MTDDRGDSPGAVSDRALPPGEVRQATHDDFDAVADFTAEIWADRGGDYIPRIYHDWIENDGPDQRTFVYEVDAVDENDAGDAVDGPDEAAGGDRDGTGTTLAGIVQGVMLSDDEAWAQGMRVNPDHRGTGVSAAMNDALFDWAAGRGATVCRNMVFSWNAPALGAARATGYEPCTEFRWAQTELRGDGAASDDSAALRGDAPAVPDSVTDDPAAAWRAWQASTADRHLRGLAMDLDESWALAELTRDRLRRAADETAVFAVVDGSARAMTYRSRTCEREEEPGDAANDPVTVTYAEYGAATWTAVDAARDLFAAVEADAAAIGADRLRVLIPERVETVSDASRARFGVSDEPVFVLSADLTDR